MIDIPATKITGLNTIAKKLERLSSFPIHQSHIFTLNSCIRMKNGDAMMNIHKSHILMTFAIRSNNNHTVKKNNKTNLNKNSKVIFCVSEVVSTIG